MNARIHFDELCDALLSCLTLITCGMLIRVVRVDLKRHEVESVQARWLDDGHVVCRSDRRARDVRPSAPTDVRHAVKDTLADALDQSSLVEAVQQMKGVAAADDDGLRAAHNFARVCGLVDGIELVAHRLKTLTHHARILVKCFADARERNKENLLYVRAEEIFNLACAVFQIARALNHRATEQQ